MTTQLTPGEQTVVAELARDGARNADIAERLHISPLTVKCHISTSLQKLELPTRAALALWWLRQEER